MLGGKNQVFAVADAVVYFALYFHVARLEHDFVETKELAKLAFHVKKIKSKGLNLIIGFLSPRTRSTNNKGQTNLI